MMKAVIAAAKEVKKKEAEAAANKPAPAPPPAPPPPPEKAKTKRSASDPANYIPRGQFKVYRDDELDPFKPYSETAVRFMAAHPPHQALAEDEEELLQCSAVTFERSMSIEQIIPKPHRTFPPEIKSELNKMPNWLSAMIECRYPLIQAYYKGETLSFFRSINLKIDREFRPEFAFFEGSVAIENLLADQDARDTSKMDAYELKEAEIGKGVQEEGVFNKTGANITLRVAEAVGKWKRARDNALQWHPHYVHKVVKSLRSCLSLKPAEADLVLTQEDVSHKIHSESEDSEFEEDGKPKYEIAKRRERLQDEADLSIEKEILRGHAVDETGRLVRQKKDPKPKGPKPKGTGSESADEWTDVEEKAHVREMTMQRRKLDEDRVTSRNVPEKGLGPVALRRQLYTRGHFRRESRLLHKGCGQRVDRPKRLEYHYRSDDNFHQYIVALVGTVFFRFFIMGVILLNAICLALESDERLGSHPIVWEILDEIFIAVYLVEAMVKIYAHPLRYWTSGFNVFDFCILVVSVGKTIIDWADIADLAILRVLLIVRALRMLRGISLSVQLQVLVAALVETIRTHVISVCLLLVLLLYIAAIIFYYIFGDHDDLMRRSWGFVPRGMLRMILFVTIDGWTSILEEFTTSNLETIGRFFNLICIVLGNFMFSNIFIAIIIMNISEATDSFRDRQRLEKQEVVRKKKDMVFRRQKLDMRQLLARQKKSATADFFYLTNQFQKLLRHDDLVSMRDVCTAPLWVDALYNGLIRITHTSNIMMNLHREMLDNLFDLGKIYDSGKEDLKVIRRSRYNRYMKIKAKLALMKQEILELRGIPALKRQLRIRIGKDESAPPSSQVSKTAVEGPKVTLSPPPTAVEAPNVTLNAPPTAVEVRKASLNAPAAAAVEVPKSTLSAPELPKKKPGEVKKKKAESATKLGNPKSGPGSGKTAYRS